MNLLDEISSKAASIEYIDIGKRLWLMSESQNAVRDDDFYTRFYNLEQRLKDLGQYLRQTLPKVDLIPIWEAAGTALKTTKMSADDD